MRNTGTKHRAARVLAFAVPAIATLALTGWAMSRPSATSVSSGAAPTDETTPSLNPDVPELQKPERWTGPNGQIFGRLPTSRSGAGPRYESIPDFVMVLNRDGTEIAGYAKKADLVPREGDGIGLTDGDVTVYAEDGATVVGTFVSNKGFVANGERPEDIPDNPGTVVDGPPPTGAPQN